MRASNQTYKEVGERCSEFLPVTETNSGFKNCHECSCKVSCTNCQHFKNEHCEIDMYDEIVEKNNI